MLVDYDWFENDLHWLLSEWFVHNLSEGERRFIIMIPRDHLKTSLFGVCTILWLALRNPENRTLYRMANSTNAEATLEVVSEILENSENIKHFFPDRVLSPNNSQLNHKRNADQVRLSRDGNYREASITARGIKSAVTGGHYNWHINDDLIDEEMIDSESIQASIIGKMKRSDAMFVNKAVDIELYIGTNWPGSFYKWLRELSINYKTCILGCYVDYRFREFLAEMGKTTTLKDGDPIWPEHFTHEMLEEIAAKCGTFDFAHQWLNIEMSDDERRFDRNDIRYFRFAADRPAVVYEKFGETHQIPISSLHKTMTIDPATGEGEKTDETAITVCGYDRKTGLSFVLETWSKRALPFELINKVVELASKWEPRKVMPEDVAYQKTLKHYLRAAFAQAGIKCKIEPVKPGLKKKGTRILDALQPFVANHQVFFLKKDKGTVNELCDMQVAGGKVVGRSPNLADSLSYHTKEWRISRVKRPSVDDESGIDYFNPYTSDVVEPAYGLGCRT